LKANYQLENMLQYAITAIFVATCSLANSAQAETGIRWSELPPLPDKHGLAGAFAGTCDGVLLVAGGANFPDKMPWDGGQKVWHDNVYAIDHPYGKWKVVGKLSQPLGYGASFSTDDGIVCIGGSDANRHYSNCFLLRLKNGELITSPLPSLPHPCANFSGAVIGTKIYIAGGTETPTSTKALQTFWGLDLHDQKAGWQVLEPWPGPGRMLSVVAVQRQSFIRTADGTASPTYHVQR
jgi:N-acetylneuraminic acid mutarotase